ncbi:MAG: ABC transporter ATP-binding protein [Opitutales bacterium]
MSLSPSTTHERNRSLLRRYTDQPEALPRALRQRMEQAASDQPVQIYALGDLNAQMQQHATWVGLTPDYVVLARAPDAEPSLNGGSVPLEVAAEAFEIRTIERTRVKDLREEPGLSCTVLSLFGEPDEPALAALRYTHRQRGTMSTILFLLRQQIEGHHRPAEKGDELYADLVTEPIRKAQASVTTSKLSVMTRLLTYLKPYKTAFITGFLGAAGLTVAALLPPWLTGYLIDEVITPAIAGDLLRERAFELSYWLLGILTLVAFLRLGFLYLRIRLLAGVGEKVARDLRTHVYDHLQTLSVNYFSKHQTGSLISRVTSDTDRIWDFIAFGVTELLFSLTMIAGLSVVLVWLDWQLGLVLIAPLPLVFLLIVLMGKRLHRVFLRVWQKWSNLTAVLSDTIPGMRVVKAFNQEQQERERFAGRNDTYTEEGIDIARIWAGWWPIIFFVIEAMVLLVWFLAIPRLLGDATGVRTMELGTFVSFMLYMGMFIGPIDAIGFLTRSVNRSISSAHRVFEVLDSEPEIISKPDAKTPERIEGRIAFENVTFGYDPVRLTLKGISFDIEPGEMIGFVGPSGAGKSTIMNLLARFYDPTGGRILVDGLDLRDFDAGAYRRQLGMVMQDPFLFHGSILDNIRYGHRDASIADAIEAARAANAHDFIARLPMGYDTIVGERGHTLSGGERQRISIARAVLHDPRILILDEATSSVDTQTERNIQEAIERLTQGRTTLAIAHRLSTLRRASRLFVIKGGRLVEQGRHEELVNKPEGVYAGLEKLQRELHEMYAV